MAGPIQLWPIPVEARTTSGAEKGIATNAVPNAELRAFRIAVAEKYYSTVRDAARAVAPNMLYLGDRHHRDFPIGSNFGIVVY